MRLVSLEVSNNHQDFTDSGFTFLYQQDARALEVQANDGTETASNRMRISTISENLENRESNE